MKKTKDAERRTPSHCNAVLLEDIRSKMELVIEGMNTTRSELKCEIGDFRKEVNQRFEIVESAIKHNSEKIENVRTELKSEIQDVRTELKDVETRLSGKIDKVGARVDNHEKRITALEDSRV